MTHPAKDILFSSRYALALLSSIASVLAIKVFHKRFIGKLSIALFIPFVFLQLAEVWVVYKCEPGIDRYWGVDCDSLLIFPDHSKLLQVITDELAVFLLGLANLFLLWECHVEYGHLIYDRKRIKPAMRRRLLSDEFISAEEGESNMIMQKVFIFCFLGIIFHRPLPPSLTLVECEGCLSRLWSSPSRS